MSETRVIDAQWIRKDGKVESDQNGKIIKHLLEFHLVQIGEREGGWTKLYRDPTNGKYWELTYPRSEMHGGGPPRLAQLTPSEVTDLYGGVHG